ncbi:MAG TPA: GGDEF domain-containing protein [Anaeromyxobacteraceae bacterium]|nr:GGDEF domain-containing protein [Anaeromyxobacteraceae bacterium]
MALDALAGTLRDLGEFPLPQERIDAAEFRRQSEAWAQHVVLATPPPGTAPDAAPGPRRDWQGVRAFVRDYLRGSAGHAQSVTRDLREVIWTFIRTLGQSIAQDEEADERLRGHVERLERLVASVGAAELKREVAESLSGLSAALEERRQRHRTRVAALGETVRSLGDELVTARREGEIDPLTRVANRKALDRHVQETLEMHRAFRQDACLVLVDVDRFKAVNDGAGHLVGDEVLRAVADAIVKVFLRRADFVGRFGGDEFAVVLRETPARQLPALADRLLARVRALRIPGAGSPLEVSVSVGGAAAEAGDDARAWFERADRGLYAAKAAGRDRFALGEGPSPAAPPAVRADGPAPG